MSGAAERAAGAILGVAVGDALGAPFEFRRSREIPDPIPAFELPWMGLPPGTWTDDTAMARNLWTSLLARDGALDLDDVLARHLAWFETSPPDVGNLTRRVLARLPRRRSACGADVLGDEGPRGLRGQRLGDVLRPPGGRPGRRA